MSDQFHKYDDYEEINDESEKFTQGIHLHNQFKKSVGFADEFLRKKLRRRKIYRITSLAAIILLLPFTGILIYNNINRPVKNGTQAIAVNTTQNKPQTDKTIIKADKILDIIVCEKMEATDASKASEALIKEFGDRFSTNIYSGNGVKNIPVSANLKTELYTALCNNTAKVAPEALSKILKQMIYSTKDAKVPSNMVVLNNLTDIISIIKRNKKAQLINMNDLTKIDETYSKMYFIINNTKVNITTTALKQSDIKKCKIIIRNY